MDTVLGTAHFSKVEPHPEEASRYLVEFGLDDFHGSVYRNWNYAWIADIYTLYPRYERQASARASTRRDAVIIAVTMLKAGL